MTENEGDKPGYHHGDLRGALLKAARIILEEQGPRALTLREAARRAGVSHAAPRYHFASLRVFMADCAATGFDELAEHLTRAWAKADGDSDPEAGLSEMGMAYVLFAMRNRAVFRLMFDRDTVSTFPSSPLTEILCVDSASTIPNSARPVSSVSVNAR